MYDEMNEAHEFVGESRQEAVGKATAYFGVGEDELVIGELPPGEVYGLGGRAVIVALRKDRTPPAPGGGGGGGRRERERDRDSRGGRGDRGRGRDRERGGRDRGDRGDRMAPDTRELSDEPSVGTPLGTLGEVGTFLLGVIERLELGPFEVGETEDGGLIVCEVKGPAARALAHGDGRAVDALQLLVNQAAMSMGDGENAKRVVLDVEGNTEAREEFLERLAERVVKRAKEGGRAVALDPMNARERRTIHLSVREHPGMATMSVGEGRYRQVVVVPEGAAEYEEALQQTEAAKRGA